MNIPLRNRLRKRAQRDVALLEDILIRVIYELDSTAEIHGGTAIWRCYGGKRFSKDIDVYMQSENGKGAFKNRITGAAEKYSATVLKVKDTGNLIFIELLLGDVYSEIDINCRKYYKKPVMKRYENLDGTFYDVLTLPVEELIREKIDAYNDRRYLTDLYDMKILVDSADAVKAKADLRKFIDRIRPPVNIRQEEERLKGLIYEGPIPSFKTLVDYIEAMIS